MLSIEAHAPKLGALVSNIDLCAPIDDKIFNQLHSALMQYEVLFFKNQAMSPQNHANLASLFGRPQLHQAYPHVDDYPQLTILEHDEANPSKIEMWHSDMTFRACPPMGAVLHSVVAPVQGGDTMFASMSAAYDALSDKMQHFLSGLTAIHDFSFGFKESLAEPGGKERLAQMVIDNPPQAHPLVRTHPVSGKKGLFVNSLFTKEIKDMKDNESRALLDFLYEHCVDEAFCCRFKWDKNSVALWDNRITQHKPINDYWPQHRRMQRITIDGDKPF